MCLKKSQFRLLLLGVLLWASVGGFAQSPAVNDSLKKAITKSDGNKKTSLLISLAVEHIAKDIDKALEFLDDAYKRSLNNGDSANIVRSGWVQSELWRRKELLDEAMNRLQYILPIAERNGYRKDHKKILNTLAVISTEKANYDLALSYNFKSLNLREEDGDKAGMSITCNNIGLNYYRISNYELSLNFYNKALRLKLESGDKYDLERLYINIGLCDVNLGEFKKAKEFFVKGLSLCKNDCDASIISQAEFGLGESSYRLKELDVALIYFKKSLSKAESLGEKKNQVESLRGLSKVAFDLNDFEQSKKYLNRAYEIAKSTSYKVPLMEIYGQFAKLADQDKDFEKASNFRKLYIQLRDSVYSTSMIKNLATIQTNYVEKENLATIEANKLVIEQQRNLGWAAVTICCLLLVIVVLFWSQKRQIRKVNKNLNNRIDEATKDLFEAHEKLKDAVFERDYFMYKTAHDLRGPLASFLGLCMVAKMEVKDAVALGHFERIETTAVKLNSILTRLQTIEQINLNAIEYTFIEFKPMVENIVNLEKRRLPSERITISYEIDSKLVVKSDPTMISIILENLINNAVKFYDNVTNAEPFVKISIFGRTDKLVLQVVDNGIGIPPEMESAVFRLFSRASDRSQTGGTGLYTAKLAVDKLEGAIGFTRIEKRTTFEAVMPMDIGYILKKQQELEAKLDKRRKKGNNTPSRTLSLVFS
jgi:signal transduction histidine kinase/Tfp pilus assembly protein PilF